MRQVVNSSWFARFDLFLVVVSGLVWIFAPDYAGASPLLLLLLPWVLRLAAKEFPFQRTRFDWFMLIFLLGIWVGYWVSYDAASALNKAWLLTTSVFLYYSLSAQPEENTTWITSALFVIGVGVSLYFFLTHNFTELPRKVEALNKIGVWWTNIRPAFSWPSIHPNYVAGVAALTGIFGLYPLRKSSQDRLVRAGILAGFFVVLAALVMTTSRGAWMALAGVVGLWLLWRLSLLNGSSLRLGREAFFPVLVLVYLCVVVAVLYVGPARSPSSIAGSPDYGVGSRAELFSRSLYFLEEYPFTGGGLAAFPGLYSRYILDIPYFYVLNSHNLFLDVFIEQGIVGGAVFLLLYLFCIWHVSRGLIQARSTDERLFCWLVLSALMIAVIHGMVDDYLYNAKGAVLSFLLIGLSMMTVRLSSPVPGEDQTAQLQRMPLLHQWYTLVFLAGLVLVAVLNSDRLRAAWYANLGAVQMAKVELAGFPETGWGGTALASRLAQADASLQTALAFEPANRTANHRLGLISKLQQDFSSAVAYLEIAHERAPQHRGIIKSLGFSYAWLDDTDRAVSLLKEIPETKKELDSYYSWWKEQGRDDLSVSALKLRQILETLSVQP